MFPSALQTEPPEFQQEENTIPFQREMVIYQGRSVSSLVQRIVPQVSFVNKMFMAIMRIMEIDSDQIASVLPSSFIKGMYRFEEIFPQLERESFDSSNFTRTKELSLEQEIQEEKNKEYM